uniref:Carboxylesterase type B domain-containing protein n=1 Tax=Acrobeloides nanus TaxID=290746 RepID=A0A914DL57_9BILA
MESGTSWLILNGTYSTDLSPVFNKDLSGGWQVIPGDEILPDWPQNLWQNRKNIPVLTGINQEEYAIFVIYDLLLNNTRISSYNEDYFDIQFKQSFQKYETPNHDVLQLLKETYIPPGTSNRDELAWAKGYSNAWTAGFFAAFDRKNVEYYLMKNNSNVYIFEHAHKSYLGQPFEISGWDRPAHHLSTNIFIWMLENDWNPALSANTVTLDDFVVADYYAETLTNFVKFGSPSLNWEPANLTTVSYMEITATPVFLNNYRSVDNVVFNHVL